MPDQGPIYRTKKRNERQPINSSAVKKEVFLKLTSLVITGCLVVSAIGGIGIGIVAGINIEKTANTVQKTEVHIGILQTQICAQSENTRATIQAGSNGTPVGPDPLCHPSIQARQTQNAATLTAIQATQTARSALEPSTTPTPGQQ